MSKHNTKSKAGTIAIALAIVFAGPVIGVVMAVSGLVLAPPWIFLTGQIYLSLACLALPIGIAALLTGRIGKRGLFGALGAAVISGLFYLALIGPWLPSGMTNCQIASSSGAQISYACVDMSSDNSDVTEFSLERRAGWPVARRVQTVEENNK